VRRYLLPILWLEVSLVLVAATGIAWKGQAEHTLAVGGTPRDTLAFYTGATLLRRGEGAQLYDLQLQHDVQQSLLSPLVREELQREVSAHTLPFVSPPFVAVLFLPATLLPLAQAHVVWSAANWALLLGLAALLLSWYRHWTRAERLVAFAAFVSFAPAYYNVAQGQVSLVLVVSVALGWELLRRGHGGSGGLVLAGLLLKPQYAAVLLLLLVLQRNWRAVAGFAIGAAFLALSSLLIVGASGATQYLHLMTSYLQLGSDYGVFPHLMTSWSGLISTLYRGRAVSEAGGLALGLWLGLDGVTLAILGWLWHKPQQTSQSAQGARYALFIIGATLLSPHVNIQDLTWILLAGLLIWDYHRPNPRWAWVLFISYGALTVLYPLYAVFPLHWNPPAIGVPTLALLGASLAWSLQRHAGRLGAPAHLHTAL